MAIKLLIMVKRRSDLTPEQFRAGYEKSHAKIAVELFGHLWIEYRRNYLVKAHNFAQGSNSGDQGRPREIGYDAVSEVILPDAEAYAEMGRIGSANRERIQEDERRWFDRPACWVVTCETIEHDLTEVYTAD